MCTQPKTIWKKLPTGKCVCTVVPCGECFECLNQKQNDNAVLSFFEAQKTGKMVFATLTYNNDSFPIMQRVGVQLEDDIDWKARYFVNSRHLLEKMRSIYLETAGEDFSTVVRSSVFKDSTDKSMLVEFSPSLRRKDFQDLLKRARQSWFRKYGSDLEFSYMLVGEYGEQNHRPHYHCAFYGIEEKQVRELLQEWPKLYGYIDVKNVERWNDKPSHDGFFAASRYLGKYLTKGASDSYNVLCGLAEKSRVCRSIGFGVPDKRTMQSLLSFTLWKIMQDIHK